VTGLAIVGSPESPLSGAFRGCRKAVEDLNTCSFKSSYRLGGYASEPADDMSRLILIRLGEGASGRLEGVSLDDARMPLKAVLIRTRIKRPIAGRAVLKAKSTVLIPSIITTLV
jgi:hypothetical protein